MANNTTSLAPVSFIGLGRMGYGMVKNLLGAGVSVSVYDTNKAAIERVVELGASAVTYPAELTGKSNLIFLCVPAGAEVRTILFGDKENWGDMTVFCNREGKKLTTEAVSYCIRFSCENLINKKFLIKPSLIPY